MFKVKNSGKWKESGRKERETENERWGEKAGKMIQNSTATWELKNEREESDRQTVGYCQ